MEAWRNWSGQQRCQPLEERHPDEPAQVGEAIAAAARRGLAVRVAGAGHSFTDAVCTPDMLLVLDRMADVLEVDARRGRVRVQAGCTLGRLSARLREHGQALANLGDIDRQTVAGALATATHGTGLELPTLAEEALEFELIDGHGEPRRFSREDDEETFRAAQVSLGALGVITAVTLRCRPAYRLRAVEQPLPVRELLDRLGELAGAHQHFEAFLFPYAPVALVRYADRTEEPADERGRLRAWVQDVLIGNHLYEMLLAAGRALPPAVPPLNRLAAAAARPTRRVQSGHDALASPRRMRFVEMEWMLPVEAAAGAVADVLALIQRHRLHVNMPLELRFVAPDGAFLSPAHERRSGCVAVHAYRGMAWQPYFRAVERRLWELGGRPHWGKLHFQTFETLRERYPAWDRFAAVRGRLDPEGRFRNSYTDRVLGLPAAAAARSGRR